MKKAFIIILFIVIAGCNEQKEEDEHEITCKDLPGKVLVVIENHCFYDQREKEREQYTFIDKEHMTCFLHRTIKSICGNNIVSAHK